MQDIDSGLAKQFSLPDQNGALVDDVLPNAPAEKAGIKSGDVIVAFNNKPVADGHSLQLAVSDCTPGSSATMKVIRKGREKIFTVTLGELPSEIGGDSSAQNGSDSDNSKADALDGVTVDDLNADAREQLRIPENIQGAIVTDVGADSNSADAGLQKGDVILEINQKPVGDANGAVKLCNEAKGDHILLKIWRRDGDMAGTHYLSVDNTKKD